VKAKYLFALLALSACMPAFPWSVAPPPKRARITIGEDPVVRCRFVMQESTGTAVLTDGVTQSSIELQKLADLLAELGFRSTKAKRESIVLKFQDAESYPTTPITEPNQIRMQVDDE